LCLGCLLLSKLLHRLLLLCLWLPERLLLLLGVHEAKSILLLLLWLLLWLTHLLLLLLCIVGTIHKAKAASVALGLLLLHHRLLLLHLGLLLLLWLATHLHILEHGLLRCLLLLLGWLS
jgi:hypothetical protein